MTERSEYAVRMRMAVVVVFVVMVVIVVMSGGVVVAVRFVVVNLVHRVVFLAVRRFRRVKHAGSHGD